MKIRNKVTKLITITMLVVLVGGLLPPIKAQTGDGSVRFVSYATVGIVHGERIRLNLANTERGTLMLSFSFYLAHNTNSSGSVPVYESELIKVPAKEFRSFDISREDLKTEGEPRTGRAQVMVKVTLVAPAGSDADDFPASLEIIEDGVQSGETVQTDSKYRLIMLAARRSKQIAPVSFIPGESLRYSVFYPHEEGDQPVRVTAYVYDSYGNTLKQINPTVLRPGDSYAFDIYRDELGVPGEDKTGRLPVRADIQVVLLDGSVRTVRLHGSMELVDSTGRTMGVPSGGDYYTGTVTVSGDGF